MKAIRSSYYVVLSLTQFELLSAFDKEVADDLLSGSHCWANGNVNLKSVTPEQLKNLQKYWKFNKKEPILSAR